MANQTSLAGETELQIQLMNGISVPYAGSANAGNRVPIIVNNFLLGGLVLLFVVGGSVVLFKRRNARQRFYLRSEYSFALQRAAIAAILLLTAGFLGSSVFVKTAPAIAALDMSNALSIRSTGSLHTAITLSSGGTFASVTDTVKITAGTPYGYDLYVSTADKTSNLYLDDDDTSAYLSPARGKSSAPEELTVNTWGYTLSDNLSADKMIWAAVPAKGQEAKIRSVKTTTKINHSTSVHYGVKADRSMPEGTYYGTVVYTAIANTTGTYQGKFVEYLQCGSQWASLLYGPEGINGTDGGSVCEYGCAPLSFAMMATALLGREISPAEVVDISGKGKQHCNIDGGWCGSYWTITEYLAKAYNLQFTRIKARNKDEAVQQINKYLNQGWMIHVSGESASNTWPFTSGGHYIGIGRITEDGKWYVLDSYHGSRVYDPYTVVDAGMRLENIKAIKNK